MTPRPITNPLHLYRHCLREASYLPLPSCRAYVKDYIVSSFRRWLPKHGPKPGKSNTGLEITFQKQVKLLHRGRKFCSMLRRANDGNLSPLEKVLRMTYGRAGPRRHQLLQNFAASATPTINISPDVALRSTAPDKSHPPDSASPSSTAPITTPPTSSEKHTPSPTLLALLDSQASEQHHFSRMGSNLRVKVRFNPPATTTWGKPLPRSRYANLKHKWYLSNLKAVYPPLPEPEYAELHDMVSGRRKIPPLVPRRARPKEEDEDANEELERQSDFILQGPKPGPRTKDLQGGLPHKITPRLLQRLLSRAVLKQTPLVRVSAEKANAKPNLFFQWDDGWSRQKMLDRDTMFPSTTPRQTDLLFG